MNIQQYLFKFAIILTYVVRMTLVILPISISVVLSKEGAWQYGFTFIKNNFEVALFVAFAIGFLLSMYHAVSFEIVGGAPLQNYLKVSQRVRVKGKRSLDSLAEELKSDRRYRKVIVKGDMLTARKSVYFLSPDKVRISVEGELYTIESRPFATVFFMDFGRNYKTVKQLARLITKES